MSITVQTLQRYKREGRAFAMITAYDYLTSLWLDKADIPVLLVGDSLGNVMLGYNTTVPVSMEEMLHHARAVSRGASKALLVGDLPFMSYEVSVEAALVSGGRMLKEGGMHAVKLEGGAPIVETVRRLTQAGVPVMGHIGLTPQKVHQMGGFKVQGKSAEAAAKLAEDAVALAEAGAFAIVLEAVPGVVAEKITATIDIPTIGIGAGPHCDGQVLVFHDLVGLTPSAPKFVKRYGSIGEDIERMAKQYALDVELHQFPQSEHTYLGDANA